MENRHIIGIGEALWDMLPAGRQIGGAPANFAYHMSQFGYDATAVSAVGLDAAGDDLVAELDKRGLNHMMQRVAHPTGTVEVTLDNAGVPQYDIRRNVAWDFIPLTQELMRMAAQCRCVCFGSLAQRSEVSRTTITTLLDAMPAEALKVFDINLRQNYYDRAVIEASLRRCRILKINDEETHVVSRIFALGIDDEQQICLHLKRLFDLQAVILTCGTKGSHVIHDDGISTLLTPRVEVADTVGAGDSFTAGFCAAILAGCTLRHAHEVAVATSAYVCTQHGAMPRLPRQITDMINDNL